MEYAHYARTYGKDISRLTDRIKALEKENSELRGEIASLQATLSPSPTSTWHDDSKSKERKI